MAPMIYLAVLDPKVGPSVLRAILAIVVEEGVDINAAQTEFDDEDYGVEVTEDLDWGVFQYDDPEDRPEDEKIWYEWLKESGDGPIQQLGWCRAVILDELKKLSKETEIHPDRPRTDFMISSSCTPSSSSHYEPCLVSVHMASCEPVEFPRSHSSS